MRATRFTSLLALAALLPLVTACGGDYLLRSQKPNIHSTTETEYSPDSYRVLGTVEAEGEGMIVLFGVFAEGEDGQGLLMAAAKAKYGNDVTGIKDITSHSKWTNVLGWIYGKIETTYYGVAIREG